MVARWLLWCCLVIAMVLLGGCYGVAMVFAMVLLDSCYSVAMVLLWCC